jgi:hypothetical protein
MTGDFCEQANPLAAPLPGTASTTPLSIQLFPFCYLRESQLVARRG